MKKRNLLAIVILMAASLVLSGCVAVVAAGGAAGSVAYVRGELQATLEEPVSKVNAAVEEAGADLGLNRISGSGDELGGKFTFRNAQNEKITINTEGITDTSTEVGIRIGLFGDQNRSVRILDAIRARL